MTTWWSRMDEYDCVVKLERFRRAYTGNAFQRFLEKEETRGGARTKEAQKAFGEFFAFLIASIVGNLYATVHMYDTK